MRLRDNSVDRGKSSGRLLGQSVRLVMMASTPKGGLGPILTVSIAFPDGLGCLVALNTPRVVVCRHCAR